jgi:hypothetical protein
MYRQPYTPIAWAFGLLLVLGTLAPTKGFGQAPQATVLAVEGATIAYQVEDMGGRVVEVAVPSLSLAAIKSKQSDGTIAAKVVAVDTITNKVKVLTQAGQIIELAMPAQDIQIGEQLKLAMPWKR